MTPICEKRLFLLPSLFSTDMSVYFCRAAFYSFQIDLRFEAKNIERFCENFRNVDYVKFPTPLRPFVTRTILVETFEVSTRARTVNIIRPL